MVKTHVEESLGANPGDAALNPADSVAMGVPASRAPRDGGRTGAFSALRHEAFRLLFAAFLVNALGFWVSHISIQALMASLTNSDALWQGYLFFALFIPAFVFAPLAGVAADRFDRKKMAIACYASIAVMTAALAITTAAGWATPVLLLGLGLLLGTSFAFNGPPNMAIAANSVPEEDLGSAVSIQSALNNLTRIVGPLLAAPLVATGRFEWAFALFFAASITAGILTARMKVRPYLPDEEEGGILARLRNGLAHARERRPAWPALVTVGTLSLFGVSHVALIPVYAKEVLGDAGLFPWIVAVAGIGAVAGALVVGARKTAPTLRSAAIQMGWFGVALFGFAWTDQLWVAFGMQLAIGYFYFSVMTSLQTLIQEIVAEEKRGRVMSLFQIAWAGLVPFGGLAMGALGDVVGVPWTLGPSALICIAFGIGMALVSPRLGAKGLAA